MQFKHVIALMAIGATTALSAATENQCGDLGVMKVGPSSLPSGADPNDIRECADHPSMNSPNTISKRSCWFGAKTGCSGGYCWSRCASPIDITGVNLSKGKWCWTAENLGVGAWRTCSVDSDCEQVSILNLGCGQGFDCNACGCSC